MVCKIAWKCVGHVFETALHVEFLLQVCLGDRIIVDVVNNLPGQSTTIHWHGTEQKGTPHMDGVPMVTQCPITEYTTFRYDFTATRVGTLYWHSHSGKSIILILCTHQKPKSF